MGVLKDISEQRRTHAGVLLLYKVVAWNSFLEKKNSQSKGYSIIFIKKEAPTRRLLHKYFLYFYTRAMNTSAKVPPK